MRYASLILLSFIFAFSLRAENVVLDSVTRRPIPGAALFTSRGYISDLSDSIGRYSSPSVYDYPLLVRALGYKPARIGFLSDTIMLRPSSPALPPDTTVTSPEKPVKRVRAFVREFTTIVTGTDSLKIMTEGNIEFILHGNLAKNGGRADDWRVLCSRSRRECLRTIRTLEDNEDHFSPFVRIASLWHDTLSIKSKGLLPVPDGYLLTVEPLAEMKVAEWEPAQLKRTGMHSALTSFSQNYLFGASTDSLTTGQLREASFSIIATATGSAIKRLYGVPDDFTILTYIEIFPYAFEPLTLRDALKAPQRSSRQQLFNPLLSRDRKTSK